MYFQNCGIPGGPVSAVTYHANVHIRSYFHVVILFFLAQRVFVGLVRLSFVASFVQEVMLVLKLGLTLSFELVSVMDFTLVLKRSKRRLDLRRLDLRRLALRKLDLRRLDLRRLDL